MPRLFSYFYIIPRGALAKDTSLSLQALGKYKNAWHLLAEASLDMLMRYL
jgi:hypothetical protein